MGRSQESRRRCGPANELRRRGAMVSAGDPVDNSSVSVVLLDMLVLTAGQRAAADGEPATETPRRVLEACATVRRRAEPHTNYTIEQCKKQSPQHLRHEQHGETTPTPRSSIHRAHGTHALKAIHTHEMAPEARHTENAADSCPFYSAKCRHEAMTKKKDALDGGRTGQRGHLSLSG